jgi:hypothetical protein
LRPAHLRAVVGRQVVDVDERAAPLELCLHLGRGALVRLAVHQGPVAVGEGGETLRRRGRRCGPRVFGNWVQWQTCEDSKCVQGARHQRMMRPSVAARNTGADIKQVAKHVDAQHSFASLSMFTRLELAVSGKGLVKGNGQIYNGVPFNYGVAIGVPVACPARCLSHDVPYLCHENV